MKKMLCLITIIAMLLFIVCACSDDPAPLENPTSTTAVSQTVENSSTKIPESSTGESATLPENVTTPPPPMYNSEDYNSVEELIKDLLSNESFVGEALNEFEEYEPAKGKAFRKFVENLRGGYLYVPYLNGKEIVFQNKEGYSNITLYPSELYSQPWIDYYPDKVQTGIICISIMYLDDDIKAEAKNKNGSELRKRLAPNYTNVDNYINDPNYEKIYDSSMEFNGKIVNTLIIQFKEDLRTNTYFVYEDILVCVTSTKKAEEWSKGLSFEKIPLKG